MFMQQTPREVAQEIYEAWREAVRSDDAVEAGFVSRVERIIERDRRQAADGQQVPTPA